jgi:hypothetical protein
MNTGYYLPPAPRPRPIRKAFREIVFICWPLAAIGVELSLTGPHPENVFWSEVVPVVFTGLLFAPVIWIVYRLVRLLIGR